VSRLLLSSPVTAAKKLNRTTSTKRASPPRTVVIPECANEANLSPASRGSNRVAVRSKRAGNGGVLTPSADPPTGKRPKKPVFSCRCKTKPQVCRCLPINTLTVSCASRGSNGAADHTKLAGNEGATTPAVGSSSDRSPKMVHFPILLENPVANLFVPPINTLNASSTSRPAN